jgi:glycosyltransferase involved in cell wall biosynthesis
MTDPHPAGRLDGPLFSVVVPVFNRPEKAARAVRSILNQSFADYEIIVVDDGSENEIGVALSDLRADPRVKVLRHDMNAGGAAARNTGIAAARGHFIAFLDSDDQWLPNKLRDNLRAIEPLRGDWLLFNQLRVVTPLGDSTSTQGDGLLSCGVAEFLFVRRGQIQTSAVVVPSDLAKRVRFDPSLRRLQDWDFYLRVAHAGAAFHAQSTILTVHNADDDPLRISANLDPEWLIRWVEERHALVTPRERRGFLANKVAPEAVASGQRLLGLRHLLPGLVAGVVPARAAAIELLRLGAPSSAFRAMRRLARHVRGNE